MPWCSTCSRGAWWAGPSGRTCGPSSRSRRRRMALGRRVPAAGLVHHSDRGCQYAADQYQRLLRDHGIICSMSRKGDWLGQRRHRKFLRDTHGRSHSPTTVANAAPRTPWRTTSKASTIPTGCTRRWDTLVPPTLKGGLLAWFSVPHCQAVHFYQARSHLEYYCWRLRCSR